ncbi:hypothetical protein IQ255_15000 [Pleurocapsales cyanobacterium LEGE 10410]|nr:hypothetical protein [Pleurocapsales cyanobacterium LEGE 10410]
MNKTTEIADLDAPIQSRHLILARLGKLLAKQEALENLIPFESFPEQCQISQSVLWDCLLALKIEPQKLDEQIYFTADNLKRLEQFIKRIEISWACPHVLATCREVARKI